MFKAKYRGAEQILNLKPAEVNIWEIGRNLSNICRFNGGINNRDFYSVAEHSIVVAAILQEKTGNIELALAGLLHDAHEAYIGDITSPVKQILQSSALEELDNKLQRVIAERFDFDPALFDEVKGIDKMVGDVEASLFYRRNWWKNHVTATEYAALKDIINGYSPEYAEIVFASNYRTIMAMRGGEM